MEQMDAEPVERSPVEGVQGRERLLAVTRGEASDELLLALAVPPR